LERVPKGSLEWMSDAFVVVNFFFNSYLNVLINYIIYIGGGSSQRGWIIEKWLGFDFSFSGAEGMEYVTEE
jgi:hypothetical protein